MKKLNKQKEAVRRTKSEYPLFTTKISNDHYRCALCYRTNGWVRYRSAVFTPYSADVAAYAASRYIRHCPELRDLLVKTAIRLGLQVGKSKPIRRTVLTPARRLELPGGQAKIYVTITAGTVTITGVSVVTP